MIRRAVPSTLLPLCVLASVLSSVLWLRSFPVNVLGAPLLGAAVLSVLVPVIAKRLLRGRLVLTALVDVLAFIAYALLIVLHSAAFGDLVSGLYHGPSQVLTFALPLVSPRSLMIAPVALTWLVGALAGESVARRWFTVLPYAAFLIGFALTYAATVRAGGDAGAVHLRETLLAGGLLATLLLIRAAQSWVRQDEMAESTQADGVLPMRGLTIGAITTVVLTVIVGIAVQSGTFAKAPVTPQRVPSVNNSNPVSPVSFIAGLRPRDQTVRGTPVFTVRTDRATPGYFAIANVDYYDGAGWSFTRTFRPSGGVLPDDTDRNLTPAGPEVTQQFQLDNGPLSFAPWMPFLYRPDKVTGIGVNIDPASGMIVPTSMLSAGNQYTVRSKVPAVTFDQLSATAAADTTTSALNVTLPGGLAQNLNTLIAAFSSETGVASTPALPFLHALQQDLRTRYALTGAPTASVSPSPSPSPPSRTPSKSGRHVATPTASPSPSATIPADARAGSTSFADVLASIVGPDRSGTPEQYATLVALVARQLGIPARVATGFRVTPTGSPATTGATGAAGELLAAGSYNVTTAEAWTWVEIPIVGSGWVVLDAAPGQYTGARQQPTVSAAPTVLPSATPSQGAELTKGNAGHAVAPKSNVPAHAGASTLSLLIAIVIGLGVIVVLLVLLLVVRKPMRVRRRRAVPDPRQSVLGAWQESLDVLTESGLPDLTNLTSAEIVELVYEQFGQEPATPADYLGQRANAVVYSSHAAVGATDVTAAWQAHQELRKSVRRELGFGQRMAARLRYHRPRAAQAIVGPQSWSSAAPVRPARSFTTGSRALRRQVVTLGRKGRRRSKHGPR